MNKEYNKQKIHTECTGCKLLTLTQIFTRNKHLINAHGTNLYGVHLAQICMEYIRHKFVWTAPGTNLS